MVLAWITGFSASGKTTIAKLLQQKLKEIHISAVLLDGDELREALSLEDQYSFEDRKKIAYKYAKLAKLIADQGITVIVSTISMFEEVREWNRRNNNSYLEIYLKVTEEERRRRDPKKLYSSNPNQMITNFDIYEEPKKPNLIFENDSNLTPETIAENIKEFILKGNN